MELTKTQKMAYEKLLKNGPSTSYKLGFGLNTLKALVKKGLVASDHRLGSIAFPRSVIVFTAINPPNTP